MRAHCSHSSKLLPRTDLAGKAIQLGRIRTLCSQRKGLSASPCKLSSDLHPASILPVVSRISCGASESPKTEAFRVDVRKVGDAVYQIYGVSVKTCFTVNDVLNGIVRANTEKWFGIYDQPRFPMGLQHVAGMKIRDEKYVVDFTRISGRQLNRLPIARLPGIITQKPPDQSPDSTCTAIRWRREDLYFAQQVH